MSPTRAFFAGLLLVISGIIGNLLAAFIEKTLLGEVTLFQFVVMAIFVLISLFFEIRITKDKEKKKLEASKDVKEKIARHRRNVQKLKQQYESQLTWTVEKVEYWQYEQEQIAQLKQDLKDLDEAVDDNPFDTMSPPQVGKLLSTAKYIRTILQIFASFLLFIISLALAFLLAPLSQNVVISTAHKYEIPLAIPTPTMVVPTKTATVTSPGATGVDLQIGVPQLVSTPPITAYQPVQFSVAITNTSNVAVNEQFFVDLFLDPTSVDIDQITLAESDGYTAVSGLSGGESRTVIVTSPIGFTNTPTEHLAYAMVDSVKQINELSEENNVSTSFILGQVATATAPTPTNENVTEENSINGAVNYIAEQETKPFLRAVVTLIDENNDEVLAITTSNVSNGEYTFTNVAQGSYTITVCGIIDNVQYFGVQTGVSVPSDIALLVTATESDICDLQQ